MNSPATQSDARCGEAGGSIESDNLGEAGSARGSLAARFPMRANSWRLRSRTLTLSVRPLLMGIVNVTPDSFSDGGQNFATDAAIERALQLVAEGADLLDIGGESTRPYATPVTAEEELRRVLPVLKAVCRQTSIPVSIDTTKAVVAQAAIEAGAEIVNDITGLTGDPAMLPLVRQAAVGICAMHMQGTPQTMQDAPRYENVVEEIFAYLAARDEALLAFGIDRARICLDPGVGFGKTHQHNLTLLAHCGRFHALGQPLLVGHSRKGFIGKVLGNKQADRMAGTVGTACSLAAQGVQILRVHDVGPVRQALELFAATGGIDGQTLVLP
jgi:dihydropteroate synthase